MAPEPGELEPGDGTVPVPDHPSIHATPPGWLELDAPDGPHALGAPTVDSDADGIADTAVTTDPAVGAGVLGLATDVDGDTHVDVLTTIDAAGAAHTVTFPPGHPGPPGWNEGVPPPPPVLDPADGRWTRLTDPAPPPRAEIPDEGRRG